MARLQWAPLDIDVWQDDQGRVIRPLAVGTKRLKSLVQASTLRWADRLATADDRLNGLAWTPLFLSIRKASTWSIACLGQHLGGGSWTMARLQKHGLADTSACLLCGEQGTLEHRIFTCPRWERLRRSLLTPHMQGISNLIRAVGSEQLAALRVPRDLVTCPIPVEASLRRFRFGNPTPGFFFTDGSATDPSKKELRAASWAVVQISVTGELTFALSGLVPADWGFDGTAYEGELFAVIQAAENSSGFFRLYTDNQAVCTGCQREHDSMATDTSRHQHLWRRLASALADRPWQVLKTKAHRAEPHASDPGHWEWKGNDWADTHAGRALQAHTASPPYGVAHRNWQALAALTSFVRDLYEQGCYDSLPQEDWLQPDEPPPPTPTRTRWTQPDWVDDWYRQLSRM
eukprot:281525-Amphidinium_carterae.3